VATNVKFVLKENEQASTKFLPSFIGRDYRDASNEHICQLQSVVGTNGRRFSGCRKKEERPATGQWAREDFVMVATDAIGTPITVFKLISGGVHLTYP
jgi:hypothetical protein